MKIVVMGSGAIGSLYGGLLNLVNPGSVTLVARSPHVDAIRANGLIIKGVMGNHTVPIHAVENASEIDSADIILITTKTYDTEKAAQKIRHLMEKGAYVVIIQNGIGTETVVSEILSSDKVLRATTCMGALITAPGEVTITGNGITEVGSHYPENQNLVEEITDLMAAAGLNVRASDNIEGVVWTKTIVNCGINPVGALTGMTNGQVYGNEILRQLVIRLVDETAKVADALGITLTTAEVDFITGAVIKFARELGIETPISESVYALIKAIESKYMDKPLKKDEMIVSVDELLRAIIPETSS